jgi:hypothetical protein
MALGGALVGPVATPRVNPTTMALALNWLLTFIGSLVLWTNRQLGRWNACRDTPPPPPPCFQVGSAALMALAPGGAQSGSVGECGRGPSLQLHWCPPDPHVLVHLRQPALGSRLHPLQVRAFPHVDYPTHTHTHVFGPGCFFFPRPSLAAALLSAAFTPSTAWPWPQALRPL